jgi:hypothetical protein
MLCTSLVVTATYSSSIKLLLLLVCMYMYITTHKQMSMMLAGHPCERAASELETFIRTVIALPTPAIPLIMNCSPHQMPCGARSSKPWDGSDLEKELGRCSRHSSADRAKEFAVRACVHTTAMPVSTVFCCYYIVDLSSDCAAAAASAFAVASRSCVGNRAQLMPETHACIVHQHCTISEHHHCSLHVLTITRTGSIP